MSTDGSGVDASAAPEHLGQEPTSAADDHNGQNPEKAEALRHFGLELTYRRKRAGHIKAGDFAQLIKVTPQYLSQIEAGYYRNGRGIVTPSDDVLDRISAVIPWSKIDMYKTLGKITDRNNNRGIFGDESGAREVEDLRGLSILGPDETFLSGPVPLSAPEQVRRILALMDRLRDRLRRLEQLG